MTTRSLLCRNCQSETLSGWLQEWGKTAIVANHISHLIRNDEMPDYCIYTLPPSAIPTILSEFERLKIPTQMISSPVISLTKGIVSIIPHDRLRIVVPGILKYAAMSLIVVDEVHKTLNKTQRTSSALELVTLAHSFIAMTGTLYKDDKIDNLLVWLQLLSSFEVTPKNYWVAVAGLISIQCDTNVKVLRKVVEEPFNQEEIQAYQLVVPESLGGSSLTLDFKQAVAISYEAITRRILQEVLTCVQNTEGVFLVAKDARHADLLKERLEAAGLTTAMITHKNPISLTPSDTGPDVVITTPTHSEGYDMTFYRRMITGVYFTNEATREQLERRINRLSQTSPDVCITVIHAGIISYVHEKYEGVRNIAAALKSLTTEFGVEI